MTPALLKKIEEALRTPAVRSCQRVLALVYMC
jgi:hypothetical protein